MLRIRHCIVFNIGCRAVNGGDIAICHLASRVLIAHCAVEKRVKGVVFRHVPSTSLGKVYLSLLNVHLRPYFDFFAGNVYTM